MNDDDNNCSNNGNCTNTDGGYNCTCNIGYNGDGFNCSSMYILILTKGVLTHFCSPQFQILMNAIRLYQCVIIMPNAMILMEALSVCAMRDTLEME